MSSSQLNLYSILDAIGLPAVVGDGKMEMEGTVAVHNGTIMFDIHIKTLLNGIIETNNSMWVLIQMQDLGAIYRASKGQLVSITLINLLDSECNLYIKSKDMSGLLSAITIPKVKPHWVVDKITC